MNLSEAFNNKHLKHLDFKQGPPRIFFVLAHGLHLQQSLTVKKMETWPQHPWRQED